jgi:hypothetical protein
LIPIKGTAIGADRRMQMQKEQANEESTAPKALELLPSEPIPAGQYLVHNDMTPTKPWPWPSRLPGMDTDQGGQSGAVPM